MKKTRVWCLLLLAACLFCACESTKTPSDPALSSDPLEEPSVPVQASPSEDSEDEQASPESDAQVQSPDPEPDPTPVLSFSFTDA